MSDIRDKLLKLYKMANEICDSRACDKCEHHHKEDCLAELHADVLLRELDFMSEKSIIFVEEGSIDITALPNTKIVEYKKGSQPPCMIKIN